MDRCSIVSDYLQLHLLKTESCKYRIEYRLLASLSDINIGYQKMAKTHISAALVLIRM